MTDRGWKRLFDEPIPLPRGRQLVTLEDAGNYITRLPKAEHEAQEWLAAMEALILVATSGGPTMSATLSAYLIRIGRTTIGAGGTGEGSMTDQEVLISTLREARRIIGEYTGPRNANQKTTPLGARRGQAIAGNG